MKGLSRGKAKWRILGNGGPRKRKSSASDRGEKGGRARMEPNREMNSEEERRLKMRKVDSEVYTVRRDLINPPNLVRWR